MLIHTLFQRLYFRFPFDRKCRTLRSALPCNAARRHPRPARPAVHLLLELLEDRFLPSGYAVTDLGTLGGPGSTAAAINNSGQVVGASDTASGAFHALLYDGSMHDLGTLGGNNSDAHDINNSGQVIGTADTASGAGHAFLYDGIMHDLGTLRGNESIAEGINNSGQVVGYSQTGGNFIYHAFLYDGSMHDLGTLGGKFSQANAINDRGQIVGYSSTASAPQFETDAFLYDNGSMIDLNSLLPAGSDFARLALASAINDRGQIVGYGITTGGQAHAFLLTPLSSGPTSAQAQPSPASVAAGMVLLPAPSPALYVLPTGAEAGQGVGGGMQDQGTFDLDAASFVVGNLASTSNDTVYGSFTPI
jgi:probable HAF family extracellular repeat protein